MRFAALLRGVNVGGKNRVPMAELRAILSDLGFSDVGTLLNSGNAVFTGHGRAAGHARAIAGALLQRLQVDVLVIVKTKAQIDAAAHENPWDVAELDASRLLLAFAQDAKELERLAPLAPLAAGGERMHVAAPAAYFDFAGGIRDSKLASALLGKGGRFVTTRNWATVMKLRALL